MTEIGIDWSFSPLWILVCFSVCGTFILAWKIPAPGSYLLNSLETDLLKNRVMLFVLLLLVKPYLITQETDPAQVRVVSLLDLSAVWILRIKRAGSHAWTWFSLI